ncbi:MAG: sialate O-acetylesterase [Planctomycetota bacterium]
MQLPVLLSAAFLACSPIAVLRGAAPEPALQKDPVAVEAPPKVQVFVLAGQSNMAGYGQVRSLERLGDDPEHAPLLESIRGDAPGTWAVRDDVHVAWLSSGHRTSGPLSVGFGRRETMVGPELMFGTVVGDAIDAPVLLVKTCWGGKDVYCDFRSPSAGDPTGAAAARLREERENGREREIGTAYRDMLTELDAVLSDVGAYVPGYAGQGYELRGLAWFQGWNDYCVWHDAPGVIDQYPGHLAALFADVRSALDAPDLPIVIGELGVHGTGAAARAADGHGPSKAMQRFRAAQREACERAGATFVPTASFWDERLAELSAQRDAWSQEKQRRGIESRPENELPTPALSAEYRRLGGHWECHYNGSAATSCLVGAALARAMLEDR